MMEGAGATTLSKSAVRAGGSVPILMVTGFLGSGKTTFLNALVEVSGWRDTVFVVNEFGRTGVDQRLLPEQSGVHLLSEGCICCAHGQDLARTLRDALATARTMGRRTERIVIETSGVALPNSIVEALAGDPTLDGHCHLAAVLTVLDASQYFDQLGRYSEVVDQIAAADLVFVSKTDLPGAPESRMRASVAEINPLCAVLAGPRLTRESVERIETTMRDGHALPRGKSTGRAFHRRDLDTFDLEIPYDVPIEALSEFTDAVTYLLGDRILRAKGFVKLREHVRWATVNIVKKTLYPPTFTDLPLEEADARIVFITEGVSRELIAEFLAIALRTSRETRAASPPGPIRVPGGETAHV